MYLYMGTSNFETDFLYYKSVLGAKLHWAFDRFGAKVAAFELGEGPLLLIADHITPPTCMPIYEVKDLNTKVMELRNRGWKEEKGQLKYRTDLVTYLRILAIMSLVFLKT